MADEELGGVGEPAYEAARIALTALAMQCGAPDVLSGEVIASQVLFINHNQPINRRTTLPMMQQVESIARARYGG